MSAAVRLRRVAGPAGVAVVALLACLGWATAGTAAAHPLGNFTVNHYRGVVVAPDGIAVDYVIDLAEIPTYQERDRVAAEGADRYGAGRCAAAAAGLRLQLDGAPLPLAALHSTVSFPAGQGGLATTRIECALRTGAGTRIDGGVLEIADGGDADRVGWREITVAGVGMAVDSDLPARGSSERLTAFPTATAAGVPRVDAGTATLRVVDAAAHLPDLAAPATVPRGRVPAGTTGTGAALRTADPLAALIGRADDGWWAMAVALTVAAGLGALHGLAPGHGKSVVAAYLVGTRGTRRQAAGLAATVALSHTSGVFVLGGVTLAASAAFPIERLYGWLQLTSAALVLGLGAWLAVQLHRARRGPDRHGHGHDGSHDHDHHDHAHQDHDHDHGDHLHRHGLLPHRHRVAWERIDLDGPLRWKPLVALGLSGGLLPSASAVIVLLGAVQVGRLGFGAALIVAFGVGLSTALVGVGLGVVTLGRRAGALVRIERRRADLARWAAPAATVALVGTGVWLTARAVLQLA